MEWVSVNNLTLNKGKCKEMILVTRRKDVDLPPLNEGIERVQELKILGVIIQSNLSMEMHVSRIQALTSQSFYALRVLRAHGPQGQALHFVCRACLETRLSYVIPAWRGFATAEQMQ